MTYPKGHEWNLSDEIEYVHERGDDKDYVIPIEDVKEFIKRLKKELQEKQDVELQEHINCDSVIDKLAGSELIFNKQLNQGGNTNNGNNKRRSNKI